jgi:D-erythronate 2-dehydrogenase
MVWWMSRPCVVDNLLHAAGVDVTRTQGRRVWLLPVQHASVADVVRAIAVIHGAGVESRVTYRPDPALEAQFASYPPLYCPASIAAGFRPDQSLQHLVQLALDGP